MPVTIFDKKKWPWHVFEWPWQITEIVPVTWKSGRDNFDKFNKSARDTFKSPRDIFLHKILFYLFKLEITEFYKKILVN